ncbi:MAG: 5-(carboxyamino)imidazole ribonucleotide mutase [Oligoflexus sp.]
MNQSNTAQKPRIAIIMGSDSDYGIMRGAAEALTELNVPFEMSVVSAHRTPLDMAEYAGSAKSRGLSVIIAGAGGAAHLPGMVAAHTELPVIGVPIPHGHLAGEDSLLSIVQMPKGVPVATVAIGNAYNAGLLAVQILAFGGDTPSQDLQQRLASYKQKIRDASRAKVVRFEP